jgi:protoporphyrinogen/coproporphyrinogen III oxidase
MCKTERVLSRHIILLGAGISGLATAWFLKKRYPDYRLTILEKSSRVGGWIQTIQKEGFLFEQGPHSCRIQGAGHHTLALAEELGLQDQVICPSPEANRRFIYYQDKLHPLPGSLKEMPFSPLMKGWLKALWQDWRTSPREDADESIASFFNRRLGAGWVERLIDPFTLGIYAGDCRQLSLKSCFPRFDEWEQQGSLFKGAWKTKAKPSSNAWIQSFEKQSLFSFKKGMETLPLALFSRLKEHVRLNETIQLIEGSTVSLASGECLEGDYLISTLPFHALAPLLNTYPDIQKLLESLSYASVTCVSLGFNERLPLKGFGYLVPSKEKIPYLGCIWDSSVFPQQGLEHQTRLTVLLGGKQHPEVHQWTQQQSIDYSLSILKHHLDITSTPKVIHCQKAAEAIPQYEVGYAERKQQLQKLVQKYALPWTLSGNAMSGVSVNDCIAQAASIGLV